VKGKGVTTADTIIHPCDLLIWAAGPAPVALLAASGFALNTQGYLLTDAALRVLGRPNVFAAGDCIAIQNLPLPRSGVHAIRQAPILLHNLVATLVAIRKRRLPQAGEVRTYAPPRRALQALNLGDGTALAVRGRCVHRSRAAWWLKAALDRSYLASLKR
jgi:NADH dehydrogenase FAD-containing subunit